MNKKLAYSKNLINQEKFYINSSPNTSGFASLLLFVNLLRPKKNRKAKKENKTLIMSIKLKQGIKKDVLALDKFNDLKKLNQEETEIEQYCNKTRG